MLNDKVVTARASTETRLKSKSKQTETSKKGGKQAQEQSKQSKALRVRRLGFGKEAAKDEQRWELGKRKETKRRKAPQDYTSHADACGGGWYTREWRPRPCGSCPCPPSRIPRTNAPLCVCVCSAWWLLLRSLSGSQVSRGERWTPQPFDSDESPHLYRPFIIHLEIIPRNSPVQLIHPSMHKYIYNRPSCARVSESVLGGYKKQEHKQCGGGSLFS